MKNIILINLIIICISTASFSQSDYNDYTENDRKKIFYDDFSTNNFGWLVGSIQNTGVLTIDSGFYELKANPQNGIAALFNEDYLFNINENKNFEIETSIFILSGRDMGANGISWGRIKNGDDRYFFQFSGGGQYRIDKRYNSSWIKIKQGTGSGLIKKSDYNKLTIRKVDNQYYFFINEGFVHSCSFEPFYGQLLLSLHCNSNSTIRISDIRISYLNNKQTVQSNNTALKNNNENFPIKLPPILSIQDIALSKNLINAGETAQLSITLKNIGDGDANGVYVNLSSDLAGLLFNSKTNFPIIAKSGGTQTINIDIKGGMDLPAADAVLKIEVVEPNFKVKIQGKQVKFPTREFSKPELLLAKFAVVENLSASPNNQIDINEQIDVKFAIQNTGQGNAENVNIEINNSQSGVMFLGVVDNSNNLIRRNPSINSIASGKYETITYRYFVNSEFTSNQLTFTITATEKNSKYGFNQTKSVEINKVLQEEGYIRTVASNDNPVKGNIIIEDIPEFVSDVDQNIPINTISNDKTFAVVIGNETYSKEIKVKYAMNDSRIFKQYLQKTLGLPTNNIHYVENATFGQILDALKWINDVIKAYNGQAKVIFYYAGHGMPDEETKSAFLLPVDGNSQNPGTAVKLAEVYGKLTDYPSVSVIVFLDACFSGATRETNGTMLSEGRGVKIKPKNDLLTGNLVVFSAATGDETAFPYTEKQHGMLTYFLLKKIQDSKGAATLNELSNYIITNVTQHSVVVNKKSQTPQVNTSSQVQNTWQTIKLK